MPAEWVPSWALAVLACVLPLHVAPVPRGEAAAAVALAQHGPAGLVGGVRGRRDARALGHLCTAHGGGVRPGVCAPPPSGGPGPGPEIWPSQSLSKHLSLPHPSHVPASSRAHAGRAARAGRLPACMPPVRPRSCKGPPCPGRTLCHARPPHLLPAPTPRPCWTPRRTSCHPTAGGSTWPSTGRPPPAARRGCQTPPPAQQAAGAPVSQGRCRGPRRQLHITPCLHNPQALRPSGSTQPPGYQQHTPPPAPPPSRVCTCPSCPLERPPSPEPCPPPHPPLVQHQDVVCVHDRAQAVGDDHAGAAAAHLRQGRLDHALGQAVQRRGGLLPKGWGGGGGGGGWVGQGEAGCVAEA
jgi:hypothetical protein